MPVAAEENWLDTAHDEYAAEEGFAVSARMVLQVTADYELALATIAAEVDETAAIAAATRAYKVTESNANLTLSSEWASLAKAYWILEATELSCRMTSLESSNGSPWAAYAADEAAAQLAWVSSTAAARETYHVTLAEEQDTYATERANLDETQANDQQAINADYDTAAWNAHLQRIYDQAYLILQAESDYPASGPAVPKPPSLGTEYALPRAPVDDYQTPASRSSPRVYTVWNWYPYAYWGYYGYYGYYGYGDQWNDYYYWSYATYPHEAASYSGYDAGLAQLRSPRELDLEDYWRINHRGKNYWDLAGKSAAVTVTTVWDLADRYDVVWGEQHAVDPYPSVVAPAVAAAAVPGTMAVPTPSASAPEIISASWFGRASAPDPTGSDAVQPIVSHYGPDGSSNATTSSGGTEKFGQGTIFEVRYTSAESLADMPNAPWYSLPAIGRILFGWTGVGRSISLDTEANAAGRRRHVEDAHANMRAGGNLLTSEGTRGLLSGFATAHIVIASTLLPGPEDLIWASILTPRTGISVGTVGGRHVLMRSGRVLEGNAEKAAIREIQSLLGPSSLVARKGTVTVLGKAFPKEIAYAEELAAKGYDVIVRGKAAAGADFTINAVRWEYKQLEAATINAVRQNIRDARKKSPGVRRCIWFLERRGDAGRM